ncbi:MAG: alkaline phosphatase family protein [Calditrichaeota bacterium]|nr:alkaline phosphatase family protein [Calditrichota bacterium]HQU71457.1 alkaline phosphatase D family protein [Calditrichia bacterium]
MKRFLLVLILTLAAGIFSLSAQGQYLQSGPMVGYSEMMEVMLWVQTNAPATVKIEYWEQGNSRTRFATNEVRTQKSDAFTAHLLADAVQPGKTYDYRLLINGKAVQLPYPLSFQSQKLWQWREDPPAFSFLIGSCFYVNDPPYDRPGTPYGSDFEVLDAMYDAGGDFMVWMGDNIYLREADWNTRTGILYRYTHTRSHPKLQRLLANMHHYASWDDHDFGPNNSDRSFREKNTALEAFQLFWANPEYGINNQPGVTFRFEWADVEFFMLDNRYYRSPNYRESGEREILGDEQIEWLIDALVNSYAPFKFVVVGGQFLNTVANYENHATYAAERERILNALAQERIPGVIFLTGDRHHTELSKLQRRGLPTLYDLTISPLTAGLGGRGDEMNELRVDSTFVRTHNFGKLSVSGPRTARVLDIQVIDYQGNEMWKRTITAAELR